MQASTFIAGGWTERKLQIVDREFDIILPSSPEQMLDAFGSHRQTNTECQIPHWGRLWPTAIMMAEWIVRAKWQSGSALLELGSGVGLTGLAALSCGLDVTMSDYVPLAVETSLANARRNGFEHAKAVVLDWREPGALQFPQIIACDVLYDRENHLPLLGVLKKMLLDDGECWIGDCGRTMAHEFLHLAYDHGFGVRVLDQDGAECLIPSKGEFQIFSLSRRRGQPLN